MFDDEEDNQIPQEIQPIPKPRKNRVKIPKLKNSKQLTKSMIITNNKPG